MQTFYKRQVCVWSVTGSSRITIVTALFFLSIITAVRSLALVQGLSRKTIKRQSILIRRRMSCMSKASFFMELILQDRQLTKLTNVFWLRDIPMYYLFINPE